MSFFDLLSEELKINLNEQQKKAVQHAEGHALVLAGPDNQVFVVADDDQSIYGFRGAEPEYLLNFEKYFSEPKIYMLETNYRSTGNIVEISSSLIRRNLGRYDKSHNTDNEYERDPEIAEPEDEKEQLEFLAGRLEEILENEKNSSIAVLYRNNLSSVVIADELERKKIDFRIKDSRQFFFTHWFVLDIAAFMNFAMNLNDEEAFRRIYHKMNRYISKAMVEFASEAIGGKTLLDRMQNYGEIKYFQKEKLTELKAEFYNLSRMAPSQALEYIGHNFGYPDNAREYCERSGYPFGCIQDLYTILKIIAAECRTLPGFLQRLAVLEEILGSHQDKKSRVTLSTVHSSQSAEFKPNIVIALCFTTGTTAQPKMKLIMV